MAQGCGRNTFEGCPVVGGAGRVTGTVDDDGFGSWRDDGFQRFLADRIPVFFPRLEQDGRGVVEQGLVLIGDPEGNRDNQFIARFKQGLRQVVE